MSVSTNIGGAREFFKRKIKRKDNRSNDFSSTLSIVPNGENKHKKTKICCLLWLFNKKWTNCILDNHALLIKITKKIVVKIYILIHNLFK